jgi:enoyl-CoA hydratase/carnithine racemase
VRFEFVDYVRDGDVALITMDRYRERRNSLSRELQRDLGAALTHYAADDAARAAVLTGVHNAFCTGADLKESKDNLRLPPTQQVAYTEPAMLISDNQVPKPVIAAVNGYAAGGGFGLAMRCDLKVAAESATFWMPETAIGWGGPTSVWVDPFLPHAIAMEISLSETITARRAYELGLVNRVVPDAELLPAAMQWARRIAALPPTAVRIAVMKVRDRRRFAFDEIRGKLGSAHYGTRDAGEIAGMLEAFAGGRAPAGPKS